MCFIEGTRKAMGMGAREMERVVCEVREERRGEE
jgi:hypothetical protein